MDVADQHQGLAGSLLLRSESSNPHRRKKA
jgi:hypothetical protein